MLLLKNGRGYKNSGTDLRCCYNTNTHGLNKPLLSITKNSIELQSAFLFLVIILLLSCTGYNKNTSHKNVPDANIKKGEMLAAVYCQSCHMLPDPLLLDTKHWENGVLPAMGPHLGIFFYDYKTYPSSRRDRDINPNYYPSKQVIGFVEWQNIIDYYTSLSPDSLSAQQRKYTPESSTKLFTIQTPPTQNLLPATCFVKIDTTVTPNTLLMTDVSNRIFRFNNYLALIDSVKTNSPVVDMDIREHKIITCNIGIINPNNSKYGSAQTITFNGQKGMRTDTTKLFDKLARPVQILTADFNKDTKTDYLICEFGNLEGTLSWMENVNNGKYEKHVLRNAPGAIRAGITDVNKDGLPDIVALFTQGDESIFLFTNKGNGHFEPQQILRFPPIYGSSYFELVDFNKDGFDDVLYTCGDNADYSPSLKPYHGVYIYLNDGTSHFKQQYFFAMHGCYKAMAKDFDNDGDFDIAAISFFADYSHHPEESFIYLENKGAFDFKPYTIPGLTTGRWMTMDAGDLDKDGKTDLVLGNFSVAPSPIKTNINWQNGPAFIVLKNSILK